MFLFACLLLLVAVFSLASATMHHRDFTPRLILSKKFRLTAARRKSVPI